MSHAIIISCCRYGQRWAIFQTKLAIEHVCFGRFFHPSAKTSFLQRSKESDLCINVVFRRIFQKSVRLLVVIHNRTTVGWHFFFFVWNNAGNASVGCGELLEPRQQWRFTKPWWFDVVKKVGTTCRFQQFNFFSRVQLSKGMIPIVGVWVVIVCLLQ